MTQRLGRLGAAIKACPNADVIIAVSAIGLAVRLIIVVATIHHWGVSVDAADYLRLGHSLAGGHGWGRSVVAPGGGPEGIRPPGYPLWLAAVLKVTGGGFTTVRLVGAAIGATVPGLVVVIALALGLARRTATIAGGLTAFLPSLVLASVAPMSESLFIPLSLAVIAAALIYRRAGQPWVLAVGGLLLGFATLVRPVGIVLAIPFILLAVRVTSRHRAVALLSAIALAVIPCAAWEARQINAFHQVVPLTTQGGFLVAGTYNQTSADVPNQPGVWLPANLDPTVATTLRDNATANEAQVGNALQHDALHYFGHHPRYDLTVLTNNTLRLFDLSDPDFERATTESAYGVGPWGGTAEQVGGLLILVLAVAGFAVGAVRRTDWPVWLAPLLLVVVTVPVQSFTRFRAPVDPYLAIAAAVCIAGIRLPNRRVPTPVAAATTEADPQPTPHLKSLTSLRFLAAFGVFAVHTAVLLGVLIPHRSGYAKIVFAGNCGVSFFFILSGFVLTWSHRPAEPGSRFVRRRAARILPNHLLTWAATALIYSAISISLPTGPALGSLVLIHAWVPLQSWYGAMDTPSWSLCSEAFFYAMFPVLAVWLARTSTRNARIAAAVGVLIALAAAIAYGPVAGSSVQVAKWLVVDFPVARVGEFVIGIVLALELRRGTLPRIQPLVAGSAVLASLVIVDLAHAERLLVIVPMLPFAAAIAAVARRELDGGLRWLQNPTAVRLGQWSFAFYLVHWLVLVIAFKLHPHPLSAAGAVLDIALSLLASVAISGLVFQLWERPMERSLRPRHDEAVVTSPPASSAITV